MYILKDKVPVPTEDMIEWGRMFKLKERIVQEEEIGDYWISTVFLGIDHNFHAGPPLVFETMIFGNDYEDEDYQTRCSTWDQAVAMHEEAVKYVKEKLLSGGAD